MDTLMQRPLTLCLMKAALVANTGATTFSSTGTIHYGIRGKAYSRAALAGTAAPTSDAVTGQSFPTFSANQGAVAVVGLDASGNVVATMGRVMALTADGTFQDAPPMPIPPDTMCPIAYLVLRNGPTGTAWRFGANNWNQTGMTTTVVDVIVLPDRPQIS